MVCSFMSQHGILRTTINNKNPISLYSSAPLVGDAQPTLIDRNDEQQQQQKY